MEGGCVHAYMRETVPHIYLPYGNDKHAFEPCGQDTHHFAITWIP